MKDWNLQNKRVTIMGLGLHGGGLASARFFAEQGAFVTVTDFKSPAELEPSINKLSDLSIKYELGGHKESDFTEADIVVKNPAVRMNNPYLAMAKRVETDISTFLTFYQGPLIAVTGSKGKSTTVSAIYHVLKQIDPRTQLGGNITVSPLTFLNSIDDTTPVILELSSWQLGDLKSRGLLHPKVSVITNIYPDHLNTYNGSMDLYVEDKKLIYKEQNPESFSVFQSKGEYSDQFIRESPCHLGLYGEKRPQSELEHLKAVAWIEKEQGRCLIEEKDEILLDLPHQLPGNHMRLNLLCAALCLRLFGIEAEAIRKRIAGFDGVPHRLELVAQPEGIKCYNDSAATIPEAANAAFLSFPHKKVIAITGGTDKDLDFSVIQEGLENCKAIILLKGSGTNKLIPLLNNWELPYEGPFDDLEKAIHKAWERAETSDILVLSPGCASFEMFKNEFHRGDLFRELCQNLS
ncbi:UDP-N-acetylmuramoyl-L-alanine--D-glutamate ligase [Spirochaeta cellobiosiphila]|uniref:UDP-N-acetylmuramoyl-L-alanine--D-glutamate ligase n=1 Tax=Spirochaeta cellobiosiphila TaxID=504483 RepID=UPI00049027BC|nr:UDP-N-acetylmuramoyl-L-alanine--D-glutamate ligase [Spirochaeta cellobiosiphila]